MVTLPEAGPLVTVTFVVAAMWLQPGTVVVGLSQIWTLFVPGGAASVNAIVVWLVEKFGMTLVMLGGVCPSFGRLGLDVPVSLRNTPPGNARFTFFWKPCDIPLP